MCLTITHEKIKFGVLVMTFIRPLTCFIFIFGVQDLQFYRSQLEIDENLGPFM